TTFRSFKRQRVCTPEMNERRDKEVMTATARGEQLLELLQGKLGNRILSSHLDGETLVVRIPREGMLDFFKILELDTELAFNVSLSVTVVDRLDTRDVRFEVVYHVASI